MRTRRASLGRSAAILLAGSALMAGPASGAAVKVAPGALPAIAKVDKRFQSYNVEMAEVIGGRFWAPYPKPGAVAATPSAEKSGGVDLAAAMFRKREPLDLKNSRRLRNLAAALGPAYVRVSGGWANNVYFQDDDAPALATPPAAFQGVLTRAQWAGVLDFAKATDAELVTSFSVGAADRDASGVWDPVQARRLVNYTRSIGGAIYAAELINEPNVGSMVGLPKGYDAATFARDQAVFRAFLRRDAPEIRSVGPGSTGEAGFQLFPKTGALVPTDALMSAEPRASFDVFSYHFYGAASKRCWGIGKDVGVLPEQALSEAWLARADQAYAYYAGLRDRYTPGAPIWITEMAEAGCGGDAWATTFLDTFRYVDQMGRLAKKNVAAIFHNTLAASDYALIDDETWEPRPSYWAALLWRRVMGEVVLDAGPNTGDLHLYAHCLRDRPGGVGLVAINLSRTDKASLDLPTGAHRYTLTADELKGQTVKLNGHKLVMQPGDQLPSLIPATAGKGRLDLPAASITFLVMSDAANAACQRDFSEAPLEPLRRLIG